ncbi:peptide ABC transporter substrate-binding protein [Halobellus rubicundus]|uniref:Peptide ABC transporter substrate-binding protein n=1 Tax=Halobellus rubicundus TaxID=2996466 RepID=A0ABD5MEN0_9EURY
MHPTYQERVLNAPDVCQNCLRLVREERQPRDPDRTRSDVTVRESRWSRRKDTTEVAFGPAETVTAQKGIFCDCGVEGSFVRVWNDHEVGRDRFRELLKRLVHSLEHKGVSLDREATVRHALAAFGRLPEEAVGPHRPDVSVDDALAEGIRYGLARAEVQARTETTDESSPPA